MSDNKEDDPQYMMNKAKKEVIMNTLAKNGNECSCACMHTKRATMLTLAAAHAIPYALPSNEAHPTSCASSFPSSDETLFQAAEEAHCDVLAAAVLSLKRAKAVKFDGMMLLMPVHKDVVVTLINPDYDPFASS